MHVSGGGITINGSPPHIVYSFTFLWLFWTKYETTNELEKMTINVALPLQAAPYLLSISSYFFTSQFFKTRDDVKNC